jgi:hypothetical protein
VLVQIPFVPVAVRSIEHRGQPPQVAASVAADMRWILVSAWPVQEHAKSKSKLTHTCKMAAAAHAHDLLRLARENGTDYTTYSMRTPSLGLTSTMRTKYGWGWALMHSCTSWSIFRLLVFSGHLLMTQFLAAA